MIDNGNDNGSVSVTDFKLNKLSLDLSPPRQFFFNFYHTGDHFSSVSLYHSIVWNWLNLLRRVHNQGLLDTYSPM